MEPIRVLHVLHSMDCGGAENLIMNLYRVIDRNKIQFDFLVHSTKEAYFDKEILSLGGKLYYVPYYYGLNYFQYRKAVEVFFNNHKEISIVHGHLGSCAGIYLDVARNNGVYTIAHSHNTTPKRITVKNLIYRLGNLKTRKVADYYFACSEAAGIDRFGKQITSSNNYQLLKNAIDTEAYRYNINTRNYARSIFDLEEDTFLIGHVGRFFEQKNHLFLIDIFKTIADSSSNVKLLLIGDGPLRNQIEEKIKEYHIEDKVILAGLRNDVAILMQAMDCFVLPSLYEGLPLVMVEAQSSGLNCVISDMVPDDCILTDSVKVIGLNAPLDDWANGIIELKARKRNLDAIDKVKEAGFDITIVVNKLESFYTEQAKGVLR